MFAGESPIKTLYLSEPRVAVIWVKSREAAEAFLIAGILQLPGGLSCRLVASTNQQYSRILEVFKIQYDHHIDLYQEWRFLQQIANCNPRDVIYNSSRFFIMYPTSDYALRSARAINEYFVRSGKSLDFAVRPVALNEFQVVAMKLIGPYSYQDFSKNLMYQRTSFAQVVQDVLCGNKQDFPVILTTNCSVPNMFKGEESIHLICPSANDSRAIESMDFIHLTQNVSLKVIKHVDIPGWLGASGSSSSNFVSNQTPKLPESKIVRTFIFW